MGNPEGLPIPVAPVVVCVIFVITVLTVNVGLDDAAPAAQAATTVMVPVAFTELQLVPVSGMV